MQGLDDFCDGHWLMTDSPGVVVGRSADEGVTGVLLRTTNLSEEEDGGGEEM